MYKTLYNSLIVILLGCLTSIGFAQSNNSKMIGCVIEVPGDVKSTHLNLAQVFKIYRRGGVVLRGLTFESVVFESSNGNSFSVEFKTERQADDFMSAALNQQVVCLSGKLN